MKSPFQKPKSESPKKLEVGPEQDSVEISIEPIPVAIVETFHKKLFWVVVAGCVGFAGTIGALTTFHIFILPLLV